MSIGRWASALITAGIICISWDRPPEQEDAVRDMTAAQAISLSKHYEESYRFSQAITYLEKAREDYSARQDMPNTAMCEYSLANLYYKTGQYHKTLLYANGAAKYFEQNGDTHRLAECNNTLGQVYFICHDYESAERYFSMAERQASICNDSLLLIRAVNNLGLLPQKKQDPQKSLQLLTHSRRLAEKANSPELYFRTILSLASSYINTSDSSGLGAIEDDLSEIRHLISNKEESGLYNYTLGAYYLRTGSYRKAAEALQSAIADYSSGEFGQQSRSCYWMLYRIYDILGERDNAYEALKAHQELSRELEQNNVFIELFNNQNDLIRQYEKETDLKLQNRRRIAAVAAFFSAVLAIVLAAGWSWKRTLKIRQKEKDLANEKVMLEMKKMQQYQLDKLSHDVIRQLERIDREDDGNKVRERIRQVSAELRNGRDEDHWQELTKYIPEFNSEFFQLLVKAHPDLSLNERRLCALLHMNMTTKEISEITRQSIPSINKARTRLRNKLGITGDDLSLQEYLSRFC